jgi:DNA-binding NarL/FixJ family response regulator
MRQPVRVVLADDHDAFVEGLGMVLSAEDDLEIVALAGDGASALQAVLTHHPDVLVVDTQMPGPAVTELVRLVGQAQPTTRVLLLAEDARLAPSSRPDPGGAAGMTRAVSARELAEAIRAVAAGFRVVMTDPPAPRSGGRDLDWRGPDGRGPGGRGAPHPGDLGAPEREGSPAGWAGRGAVHSPGHGPDRGAGYSPDRGAGHSAGHGAGYGPDHGPDHGAGHSAGRGVGRPERDEHAELLLRSLSERERQILALLARGYSNRRIAEACFLSLNTVRTHVQNVLVKLGVHSKLEAAALAVRQGLVSIEDPIA